MKTRKSLSWRKMSAVLAAAGMALLGGCATFDESAVASGGGDLQSIVVQRLSVDPMTRDNVYGVEAVNGQVTIRGAVQSEAERMRVLSIVRGAPGVLGVTDRLRVVR
ncbi:MAG: BON domain-containing protein [Kiritimatiellae bacterium]|nr:BON domain-containing protein [Kiritimatiellia bacterium]MCO5062582.1 BON domain-containing protein [Kiritimatiellia bacterium]MCO6400000.1 BON domain-containing protein [Verrucomicrobiota bacterium]